MKTVHDFQETLEYVNRLGIVNPTKPIGWRQQDLCNIVEQIERWGKPYPFKVRYLRQVSEGLSRAWFKIDAHERAINL